MFKKSYTVLTNNFNFCLFYLFSSFCFVSFLKEIPYIYLLSKVALLWGLALSIIHIIKIIKRRPNLIELSLYNFLGLTLLINLIFYRSMGNLKIWLVNFIILSSVFYINLDKRNEQLEKELKIISNLIALFTFIFSLACALMYFANITFTLSSRIYGENHGLYINQNTLTIAASIGMLVSLYILIKYPYEKFKLIHLPNILLQIVSLIFSSGRSAYILVIAIIFVIIFVKFKNKFFRFAMIFVPSIFFISSLALFHEKLYDFLSGRNELWYSAWLSIKENPIFGIGNEALADKISLIRPTLESGGLHNIYLQIITANGVFALISFLSFIYLIFAFLIKKLDKSYGIYRRVGTVLLCLFVVILFINLFESNLLYRVNSLSIIFWIYLGYFVASKFKKNH